VSRRFVWRAFKASFRLSALMTIWLLMTILRWKRKYA